MGANRENYRPIRAIIAEQASLRPDQVYVHAIEQSKDLTYADLHALGNRMAQEFAARGLKANDRVVMLSENSIEFMATFIGVQRYGATIATANVEMNRDHIAEIVKAVQPALVLIQEGLGLEPIVRGATDAECLALGTWDPEGGSTGIFACLEVHDGAVELEEVSGPEDIAVIFYTSGTEAKPKGVLQSHRSVWANFDGIAEIVGIGPDDRMLECRSYTWLSSQNMTLGAPLVAGATVYFAKKFSRSRYFDWIRDYRITIATSVPTILNMLMTEPVDIRGGEIPHLKFLMTSSAPMLPERWREFEDMYGIRVCQSYGCSEAGLMCSHRGGARKIGTVGLPLKHQTLRLLDPDGGEVAQGEPGEITVSGPQLTSGYLRSDGSVQDLPRDGHRTGDLAVRDEDGHIKVVGRLKDLIIRGGVNISPVEIDNILSRHPEIIEGATVGIPDKIYGDEVVAYVVQRTGSGLSREDVIAHCGQFLAPFKTPKDVRFVDALPKNARGKLDRDALARAWPAPEREGA
jgi:acyl-CoA synthetase (AMP-forming)/AMP-acid ligase II